VTRYEGEIQVERKGTTRDKLTICTDGRVALKLRDSVDKVGEAWLTEFARLVVADALATLPHEKTLRGRFGRDSKRPVVKIDLTSGHNGAFKTVKSYVSESMELLNPPETV
jgi:hypothetical protein